MCRRGVAFAAAEHHVLANRAQLPHPAQKAQANTGWQDGLVHNLQDTCAALTGADLCELTGA